MQAQVQRQLKCKGSNVLVVYLEDLFLIESDSMKMGGLGGEGGGHKKKMS